MEDQRDLISNHEQLPILGQRPGAPERYVGAAGESTENPGPHRCAAGGLDGEPQEGRIPALTPGDSPKPLSKMRVATPMMMQALPIQSLPQGPTQNATEYGNMTQDHVMHLLLEADPLKVYPKLKGSFPENLKHLKNTMETLDWKVFENWMYQWLLFEMSKNSLEKKSTEVPLKALTKCQEEVSRIPDVHPGTFRPQCDENGNYKPLQCYGSTGYCWCVFPNGTEVPHTRSHGHRNCSEPLDMEDLSSGLGMTK
ncbi:HLA class II histocompatibility antigen gamma chain isoform 2-T3 [Lycaon pictus]